MHVHRAVADLHGARQRQPPHSLLARHPGVGVESQRRGAERVLHGVLEGAKGLIHGITCGAGMPYRLADIARDYGVYYYPIVSSGRAFSALWKRAYHKVSELMAAVVYEDPWLAGGHNGLSNVEDPKKPEPPFPRVLALRETMREFGLGDRVRGRVTIKPNVVMAHHKVAPSAYTRPEFDQIVAGGLHMSLRTFYLALGVVSLPWATMQAVIGVAAFQAVVAGYTPWVLGGGLVLLVAWLGVRRHIVRAQPDDRPAVT